MHDRQGYEETGGKYHLSFPIRISRLHFNNQIGYLFYPHWHQEFEIFYVTAGTVLFTVDDVQYVVKKGECVFVPSKSLHFATSASGLPVEFLAIVFYGTAICETENSVAYRKYITPVLRRLVVLRSHYEPSESWSATLLERLQEIGEVPSNKLSENELFIRGKLCEVWSLCFTNPLAVYALKDRDANKLEPVLVYIEHHYAEDLSLEQLAAIVPLSVGQFCRVFKQYTGFTPIYYVRRHRILQSCRLLQDENLSITDVANACGFNNISYFNKMFRIMIGCTPSTYRRESLAADG